MTTDVENTIAQPCAATEGKGLLGRLFETKTVPVTVFRAITYPVAAAIGFWSAAVSVHNSTYAQAMNLGAFTDILEKATPKSKADIQERIREGISVVEYLTRSNEEQNRVSGGGERAPEASGPDELQA